MDGETLTSHPGGFIEDESTGVDRAERIRIARELGEKILTSPIEPIADFRGKDRILLAFAPTSRYARTR